LEQEWLSNQYQVVGAREVLKGQAQFTQTLGLHEVSVVND
jgi:hypothetical protein